MICGKIVIGVIALPNNLDGFRRALNKFMKDASVTDY